LKPITIVIFLLTFVADLLDSRSYCRLYLFTCCYLFSIFLECRFTFAPAPCVCCSPYSSYLV